MRAQEVKAACEVAGFEYEIMDNHDGYLEASLTNRDNLIRIIRRFQPDIIFTQDQTTIIRSSSYIHTIAGRFLPFDGTWCLP